LPAALFRDREFVVDAKLSPADAHRVVQFQVLTTAPRPDTPLDTRAPCLAAPGGDGAQHFLQGLQAFRRCFPIFICYPRIIPDDEVVCLKLYHREDEALTRLFLDEAAARRLDQFWAELRFISQWPVTEHKQLPLFIGFVTQDQPKELVAYFESQREPFRRRAEAFEKERLDAEPRQLEALVRFAAQALLEKDLSSPQITGILYLKSLPFRLPALPGTSSWTQPWRRVHAGPGDRLSRAPRWLPRRSPQVPDRRKSRVPESSHASIRRASGR